METLLKVQYFLLVIKFITILSTWIVHEDDNNNILLIGL